MFTQSTGIQTGSNSNYEQPPKVGTTMAPKARALDAASVTSRASAAGLLFDGGGGEALHGAGDCFAGFGEDLRIVEVGGGDDDGVGAGVGLFALERIVRSSSR